MSAPPPVGDLELDGRNSALLVAALFMLDFWSFETEEARAMLKDTDRPAAAELSRRVSSEWTALLSAAGLWEWKTGVSVRARNEQRGQLVHGLQLRSADLAMSVFALKVSFVEFARNWNEFLIVSLGIDGYELKPMELMRLAARLTSLLEP